MTDTAAVPVPQLVAPSGEEAEPPPSGGFAGRVARITRALDRARGTPGLRGQLAELRRMGRNASAVPPAVFWEMLNGVGAPAAEEDLFRRLLPLMAAHRHEPKGSLGAALDQAGVTPARLERWLRADHDDAWQQAPRMLERLADAGVNWVPLAYLLRDWTDPQRTAVARDFFRSRYLRTATKGA